MGNPFSSIGKHVGGALTGVGNAIIGHAQQVEDKVADAAKTTTQNLTASAGEFARHEAIPQIRGAFEALITAWYILTVVREQLRRNPEITSLELFRRVVIQASPFALLAVLARLWAANDVLLNLKEGDSATGTLLRLLLFSRVLFFLIEQMPLVVEWVRSLFTGVEAQARQHQE